MNPAISVQLWSLRDQLKDDVSGTLKAIAKVGYQGVETAGLFGLSPEDFAAELKANQLECSGMHVSFGELSKDAVAVIQTARTLETRDIICPYFPRELLTDASAFRGLGKQLDDIGQRLADFGLRLHYHNHDFEVIVFEGRIGLDWLFDHARPANLGCEPDLLWLHSGGKSPLDFVREQGRRIELVHVRDEPFVGEGKVPLAAVIAALREIQVVRWWVIEGSPNHPDPWEFVHRSHRALVRHLADN